MACEKSSGPDPRDPMGDSVAIYVRAAGSSDTITTSTAGLPFASIVARWSALAGTIVAVISVIVENAKAATAMVARSILVVRRFISLSSFVVGSRSLAIPLGCGVSAFRIQ